MKEHFKGEDADKEQFEGQVHGPLAKWYFDEQPSKLASEYNMVLGAGAIRNGKILFNSSSMNKANDEW